MNKFLFTTAAFFPASLLCAQEKPNVVLILADDLGYGDVSLFNPESKWETPNIDEIGKHGIVFTDAHAIASISSPSRYGIVTGQYSFRTRLKSGALKGWSPSVIKEGRRTIGNLFQDNGYDTACIGKWHLGWNWPFIGNPENHNIDYTKEVSNGLNKKGFEYSFNLPASLDMPPYVFVENGIPTECPDRIAPERKGSQLFREGPIAPDITPETCLPILRHKAIDYILSRENEETPFFLYFPITAPHTPILPDLEFQGESGVDEYGDFVLMVDDLVGQIKSALEQTGLAENTIIIFTSDNGPAWSPCMNSTKAAGHSSTYVYRGRKFDLYEGGHRMPLLISWGNRFHGSYYDGLISLSDFYATFAEMLEYELRDDEAEDSWSFYSVLQMSGCSKRKSMAYQSGRGELAYRSGKWKILFTPTSGGSSFPTVKKDKEYIDKQPLVQLFNLENDPSEQYNLARKYPRLVRKMTSEMRKIILTGRSTPGKSVPDNYEGMWNQAKYILDTEK